MYYLKRLSLEATVIPVWKTAICKRGICKWGILKIPVFYVLNFKGWIKLIFDRVDLCNFVINEFNPTSEVQNMGNWAFQNSPFRNGGYSCLWAQWSYCRRCFVENNKVKYTLQMFTSRVRLNVLSTTQVQLNVYV